MREKMKKIFLQAIMYVNLISGVQASDEFEAHAQGGEIYSSAIIKLYNTVKVGPSEIEPVAPTGELRGFTFPGSDEELYNLFKRREFVTENPYHLLVYACGTGRWAAMAAARGEADKVKLNVKAIAPRMQPEHLEYFNAAWTTYVRENRSSHGSLSVGQASIRDIPQTTSEKFNAILVSDAIHLSSDEQVTELFQLGSGLTDENGSIVISLEPSFATIFWHPLVREFLHKHGLTPPSFDDIFYNQLKYETFLEKIAQENPGVHGQVSIRRVCLPVILAVAEANGWWLQTVQMDGVPMTSLDPITESHLYDFVINKILWLAPKPGEEIYDPSIILRFKKKTSA
jgi:hypothetical protein